MVNRTAESSANGNGQDSEHAKPDTAVQPSSLQNYVRAMRMTRDIVPHKTCIDMLTASVNDVIEALVRDLDRGERRKLPEGLLYEAIRQSIADILASYDPSSDGQHVSYVQDNIPGVCEWSLLRTDRHVSGMTYRTTLADYAFRVRQQRTPYRQNPDSKAEADILEKDRRSAFINWIRNEYDLCRDGTYEDPQYEDFLQFAMRWKIPLAVDIARSEWKENENLAALEATCARELANFMFRFDPVRGEFDPAARHHILRRLQHFRETNQIVLDRRRSP